MHLRGSQLLTAALVIAICGITTSALFGEHGLAHLLHLRAERQELGRTTFALFRSNAALRAEIAQLRNDDLYLETLARRRGLVRPDETIYRFRRNPARD